MTLKKGFTLIELILVVAIVAVLAGAMIPVIRGAQDDAKIAKILETGDRLFAASKLFYSDTGKIPRFGNDLLVDGGFPGWDGPYIDRRLSRKDHPFGGGSMLEGRTQIILPAGKTSHWVEYIIYDIDQSFAEKVDNAVEPGTEVGLWWLVRGRVRYHGPTRDLSLRYYIDIYY